MAIETSSQSNSSSPSLLLLVAVLWGQETLKWEHLVSYTKDLDFILQLVGFGGISVNLFKMMNLRTVGGRESEGRLC